MMQTTKPAVASGGRELGSSPLGGTWLQGHCTPVALTMRKHGRACIICKLVKAWPLDRTVLAMVFRHRRLVKHVSLPPEALVFARAHGAQVWVVRLDAQARCLGLPLSDVEHTGWLHRSEGRPEWFVPLSRFHQIAWQDWPFVTKTLELATPEPVATPPTQMALF